jgi:hypothetical protein
MRMRSQATDYDVICAVEGATFDFREELGAYFVCECKDWNKAATATVIRNFFSVLESIKCQFGVIFSKHGISGQDEAKYANRERLKRSDKTIVVFSEEDLKRIGEGLNFFSLLRDRYEESRLDLPPTATKRASLRKQRSAH